MANAVKYSSPGTLTLTIAGDGSSPTLKNLANGSRILSNAISTTRDELSDWRLRVRLQSAPTAGRQVRCWFIQDVGDASAYEDGDASTEPLRQPDLIFAVRAVTTQQVIAGMRGVKKPNSAFKVLLLNDTGQTFTNTNDETQLHHSFYNDEIQ